MTTERSQDEIDRESWITERIECGEIKPWVVSRVSRSDRSGVYVEGINRYDQDRPFYWHLPLPIVQFDRYDFTGATFDGVDPETLQPGALKR